MGFRKDSYATVWSVENGINGNPKVRLSTSRKNKDRDYEQDFSGFCLFVSNAKAKAARLKERDRIKLGNVDVTTRYDKDKGVEYVNYTVFDFEMADSTSNTTSTSADSNDYDGDVDEDTCPF